MRTESIGRPLFPSRGFRSWARELAVVVLACLVRVTMTAAQAQASGVPVGKNGCVDVAVMSQKAEALKEKGLLLDQSTAEQQLKRTSCVLSTLPESGGKPLSGRAVWQKARASFVRIGWYFLCPNCEKRHINFGGGFYLTEDGVAATACHVVAIQKGMRDGFLVAATEDGLVMPVLEILAANEAADTAVVRIQVDGRVQPLAINPDAFPGDAAWCYSNPLERSSYFSGGFVTRFTDVNTEKDGPPMIRMGVSTEWAPGSSGAAVLDECGNAIGLVSALEVLMAPGGAKEQYMTIHHAACAAQLLRMVSPGE